jgi:hypothetical protein
MRGAVEAHSKFVMMEEVESAVASGRKVRLQPSHVGQKRLRSVPRGLAPVALEALRPIRLFRSTRALRCANCRIDRGSTFPILAVTERRDTGPSVFQERCNERTPRLVLSEEFLNSSSACAHGAHRGI